MTTKVLRHPSGILLAVQLLGVLLYPYIVALFLSSLVELTRRRPGAE